MVIGLTIVLVSLHSVIEKLQEVTNIDLISCLNVLDRCADPHQIMADVHATLSDDGRAIVALVLPYSHYVESSKSAPEYDYGLRSV